MRSLAIILLLLTGPAAAQTPGFWLVGTAPGMDRSVTRALSQDGSIAAGYCVPPPFPGGPTPGFTWTAPGGRYDFGLESGMPHLTAATGLTSDGATIVGYMSDITTPTRAFRRVGNGPLQDLGASGYQESYGLGVSGDGSVVVGHLRSVIGTTPIGEAFRWTEAGGMQPLGHLRPLSPDSQANAVSRDGTTIVGESVSGITEGFVWRDGTGMVGLPPLPGSTSLSSAARGVNADGSVIVGNAEGQDFQDHPVRWTAAGAQDLGMLPGAANGYAYAASDDGLVIGGNSLSFTSIQATVWTPAIGTVPLVQYLASFGIGVPTGWTPAYIYAVSGDGRTFAGEAWSGGGSVIQGFVATVPAPNGAVVLVLSALLVSCRRRA